MFYKNTRPEFGPAGPYEAADKTELAEYMLPEIEMCPLHENLSPDEIKELFIEGLQEVL